MIGQLNMYVEPGTVMGPTRNGELVTALKHVCEVTDCGPDCHTTFRHAQTKDFQHIREPRSVIHSGVVVHGEVMTGGPRMKAKYTPGEGWNGRP